MMNHHIHFQINDVIPKIEVSPNLKVLISTKKNCLKCPELSFHTKFATSSTTSVLFGMWWAMISHNHILISQHSRFDWVEQKISVIGNIGLYYIYIYLCTSDQELLDYPNQINSLHILYHFKNQHHIRECSDHQWLVINKSLPPPSAGRQPCLGVGDTFCCVMQQTITWCRFTSPEVWRMVHPEKSARKGDSELGNRCLHVNHSLNLGGAQQNCQRWRIIHLFFHGQQFSQTEKHKFQFMTRCSKILLNN